jgi:hypothetical protein
MSVWLRAMDTARTIDMVDTGAGVDTLEIIIDNSVSIVRVLM